jgi:AAA family ATPase
MYKPVHLRYLTGTQTLELTYEGQTRRFTVRSVSAPPRPSRSASNAKSNPHVAGKYPPHQLWIVGWDTTVTVINDDVDDDINVGCLHSPLVLFFSFF